MFVQFDHTTLFIAVTFYEKQTVSQQKLCSNYMSTCLSAPANLKVLLSLVSTSTALSSVSIMMNTNDPAQLGLFWRWFNRAPKPLSLWQCPIWQVAPFLLVPWESLYLKLNFFNKLLCLSDHSMGIKG